jgi:hypothetical protein
MGWFSIRCLQSARWHNIFIRGLLGALAIGRWDGRLIQMLDGFSCDYESAKEVSSE